MYVVGIDGCKYGWLAVFVDDKGNWDVSLHPSVRDMIRTYPDANRFLIDIPMGLSEGNVIRNVDAKARELLKPNRTSTIFTPPCREALYQDHIEDARRINMQITKKSISLQAWYISPKIREVDQLFQKNMELAPRFFESHPEICFRYLNEGLLLQSKKSTPGGIEERLAILKKHFPLAEDFLNQAFDQFPRKFVKPDDIVDAICLAVAGIHGEQYGYDFVQSEPFPTDSKGIEIRISYFDIRRRS